MIKNPYDSEIPAFIPLKIRGMTTNAFLTENKKALGKELDNNPSEIIPYKLGAVSFNMVKEPKHSFYHRMTIQMGQTAVTQELFEAVMGFNPSGFKGSLKHPVEKVTWFDCISFCNKLSELLGLQACYKMSDIVVDEKSPGNIKSAEVIWKESAKGFRLPTDLEWGHFAKAGTNNEWAGTNDEAELEKYAWYWNDDTNSTHPVGEKLPNEWGFYDMSGNVWEWCWDKYDPEDTDPLPRRLTRGGCAVSNTASMNRTNKFPNYCERYVGFRICRRNS